MPRIKRPKAPNEEERLERRRKQARDYKDRNRKSIGRYRAKYYKEHKETERLTNTEWFLLHREKKVEYGREYRERYAEELRKRQSSEQAKEKRRTRENKRYSENPAHRLRICASVCIRQALQSYGEYTVGSRGGSKLNLLGCSIAELVVYIEQLFQPEMTWKNYGKFGWHVDHIRPCSSFDLTDEQQIKMCFHYTNLQPLWWRDNIIKGNRW